MSLSSKPKPVIPLISRVSSDFSKIQLFRQTRELAALASISDPGRASELLAVGRARSRASSPPSPPLVSRKQSCFLPCLESVAGETARHGRCLVEFSAFCSFPSSQGHAADNLQPALCQQPRVGSQELESQEELTLLATLPSSLA